MIFITGDVHREQDIHKINPDEFTIGNSLTNEDYVIICGDFGCVWDGGKGDCFWLNWLESLPWNTLFVDGNHENFDLLNQFPVKEWHGGLVHEIRPNVLHLMRGEVFDLDSHTFFTFGGGVSHDVMCRTENKNWWKAELPKLEEAKHAFDVLQKRDWKVDFVLSHDIYASHPFAKTIHADMNLYGNGYCDIQKVLEEIQNRLDYTCWFHGHYHQDYLSYSDRGKPCLNLFDQVIELASLPDILKDPRKFRISK